MLLMIAISIITSSCKKTPQPDTGNNHTNQTTTALTKLGETYILGAKTKAIVYSSGEIKTGYNTIYVSLYDSIDGSSLSNGHLEVMPIMNDGLMYHSAPVENTEDSIATNGIFKCAVIFTMAGSSSEWSLNLMFHNHKNNLEGTGNLGVAVTDSSPSSCINTILAADSNRSVIICLREPKSPVVGVNDFELVIYEKLSMMEFSPLNNYIVEIDPEMPSMGHGSPNNVNPIVTGNGHYNGKVNFTMTGQWNIKLNISKNGSLICNDKYFEVNVQ